MGTFVKPENIDYFGLDIDRYLTQLRRKYALLSKIKKLPEIDDRIKELQSNNFESKELFELQELSKEYRYILPEISSFWGRAKSPDETQKEYYYFTREELQQIKISNEFVEKMFEKIDEKFENKIDEIEFRKKGSSLAESVFYSDESVYLLDFNFEYLDEIIDSKIVANLDIEKYAERFLNEIVNIKAQIYVEEKIRNQSRNLKMINPVKWNGKINELATIFIALKDSGIISGSNEDIKRFLLQNFVNSYGEKISKNTIDDIFKPSKGKINKKINEEIIALINNLSLSKTAPNE